jgi:hypothetical protein
MVTSNKNLLSLTGFKLTISGNDYGNTEYFAVTATLPSITLPEVALNYRNRHGYIPGDRIDYDPISIRIAIDEELKVYDELYGWIKSNTLNQKIDVRDMMLTFMTSHNNPSRTMHFTNAFPTSIGSVEFNTQMSDVEYAYVDVSFRYDDFKFI